MSKQGLWLLIAFIFTACTAVSPTPSTPPTPLPPLPLSTPAKLTTPNDTAVSQADCRAGNPEPSPLYNHHTNLTFTPDGLNFPEDGSLILPHTSVPDIVIGPDGALWAYFVNGEPGQHGIFAARETASGWEIVDCVRLNGQFDGNAVDPDITRLADGRYRLVYFLGNFVNGGPPAADTHNPIYSAISEDGIHFTIENLLLTAEAVTDPSLLQLADGRWLLALAQTGHALLAASDDGKTFTPTGVSVVAEGIPELGLLADGRVILFMKQTYISADGGQTWTLQPNIQIPGNGADPSITPLATGGYAFAYKTFD